MPISGCEFTLAFGRAVPLTSSFFSTPARFDSEIEY